MYTEREKCVEAEKKIPNYKKKKHSLIRRRMKFFWQKGIVLGLAIACLWVKSVDTHCCC